MALHIVNAVPLDVKCVDDLVRNMMLQQLQTFRKYDIYIVNLRKVTIYLLTCNTEERIEISI